jgi:uncharacterized membrane protein YbhN (UPF0104 family)
MTAAATPRPNRVWWRRARLLGGGAVLSLVAWRLGTGPFLDGLRTVDASALVAASVIAVVTTLCCAWRWRLVARGLGVDVPLPTAVAAYYRSQFLNTTLPGGVVGDVERAVGQGRDVGDIGLGVRAVAWERGAGQAVQVVITLVVLLAVPSPARSVVPLLVVLVVVGVVGLVLLGRAHGRVARTRPARALGLLAIDLREGLLDRRAWPGVIAASVVVVTGHVATFVVAARTAGSTASIPDLLPLALLVLLAMAVPASVGGWGPREGAAAWVFAMAGLGAGLGVATAVVYGVMVLVASLPGAVVLLSSWLRARATAQVPATSLPQDVVATVGATRE